ncbi:hypothetical protein OG800_49780 (plasmid) [Streptomyces sp. NBC_00445]|uniref:hypothetical protein n=1 Tax=Streptomyces sp. NBC_00445 TaxID=2975745 RepID=UPI002E1A67D0
MAQPPPRNLPVPAPVPEFLAPRVQLICSTVHHGNPGQALDLGRALLDELTNSHGPLHPYTLHALELAALCAHLDGQSAFAAETSVRAATGWARTLPPGHRHTLRHASSSLAYWLAVSDAQDAVRTGKLLLPLLLSVFGPSHRYSRLTHHRLRTLTGPAPGTATGAKRP